jgi:dihydrofolate reductase
MKISIIAAVAENNIIGSKNKLPWNLPNDLKHFHDLTAGHSVIMGQKTHLSIGRVLSNRTNIILTFDENYRSEGCITVTSIQEALRIVSVKKENEVFIIGGASIYKQFMEIADRLYITKIHHKFIGDVVFPEIDLSKWTVKSSEKHNKDDKNPYAYDFIIYEKKKSG